MIDRIFAADALFVGSPIYLGDVTSQVHALMERLHFCALSYDDYDWDATVIRDILTSKEYIGMTVNHKKYRPIYKDRSQLGRYPKDEWQYIENTHEPIIREELPVYLKRSGS